MIRHRPSGLGHPYRTEPDQRVPPVPIAGEPIELRATTDQEVRQLKVEVEIDGRLAVFDAARAESTIADPMADGHLAGAAAAGDRHARPSWSLRLDPLAEQSRLRYRFVATAPGGREQTRWFTVAAAGWEVDRGELIIDVSHTSSVTHPTGGKEIEHLIPGSVSWLVADKGPIRVRFALHLEPQDHVVGFGERFDALDQRGRQFDAVVFEQYKGQGARTYLPVPFAIVVGRTGWGFHVATSRRTWFDVGKTASDKLWIEAALDSRDLRPTVRLQLWDGSPYEVLSAFLEATEAPCLPPGWIFRPWMSGNEWNTQARVMAEVERSASEGIPVGVVVIEAWSDESTFTAFRDATYPIHPDGAPHRLRDFQFPGDGAWPNPKAMVDHLHQRGVKVLLWQVPFLRAHPAPGTQARCDQEVMVNRGYAIRQADGRPYRNRAWWFPGALMPDFTSESARQWWLGRRRYLVEELGIDGFKTDGGEHAWGDDLRYADGSRGDVGNNRYPIAYAAAYHELLAESGREGITFSRSGFTGSAAYPCHWAGDEDSTWEAFRASITAGLTAGASGLFFWGWDLAGFSGEIPSAELYLRAAAMACFCPIMQYHSEFNHHLKPSRDRTPWNIAERTGDPRVLPIYKRFATLREHLVPYLQEQAAVSVERRLPLMRALFFEAPQDAGTWDWPSEYLLGNDLLVAPVTQPGTTTWHVYVLAGQWIDAWTGEEIRGPATVERRVPLHEIPVYLRAARGPELLPLFRAAPSVC